MQLPVQTPRHGGPHVAPLKQPAARSRRQLTVRALLWDDDGSSSSQQPAAPQRPPAPTPPLAPWAAEPATQPPPQQQQPQLTPWSDQPPSSKMPRFVMTQRGIPSVVWETPAQPCRACGGSGKVLCGNCRGKGRVNYRGAAMLPQGAWPEWCPCCRATGRWYCERCMGTGVRRDPIGFRLGAEDGE